MGAAALWHVTAGEQGAYMQLDEQGQERASHRHGGLLWQRTFRLLWIGETISQLGNAMALVGVPLVAVTVLHASTLAVSLLTAAAWLPWLVIGLPSGAWVDRLPPRRVMIACDVISATLYASVPITAWAGVLSTGLVVVIQLLAGAASVLFMTAYQVYLPAVVTPGNLVEGNTKMQGSASAAAFAGPGLAGLVAQLLGAVTALLFNAISFVVSAACLLSARRTAGRSGHRSQQRPAAPPRSTLRREIADGLLLVLRDPFLRQLSVFWAVANLALTGYAALLVVFLVRVIGLTPGVVGLLAAIPGIGGILGTWLGIRHALWILLGALTLSGTLLLTRALTGRRDLPGTVPAAGLDRWAIQLLRHPVPGASARVRVPAVCETVVRVPRLLCRCCRAIDLPLTVTEAQENP
jgi:MFS family permease